MNSIYVIVSIIVGVFFAGMALSYVIFEQFSIEPYSELRELEMHDLLQDKNFREEIISKIMSHVPSRDYIIQEIQQSEKYLKEFEDKISLGN
ncbi:MAG: hypothetical protein ACE5DL_03135 [Nitrosopumilaceae archaeon]